jgi:hypothetical protein
LAVNVETKEIVAVEVTDERVSDGSKSTRSLIRQRRTSLDGRLRRRW